MALAMRLCWCRTHHIPPKWKMQLLTMPVWNLLMNDIVNIEERLAPMDREILNLITFPMENIFWDAEYNGKSVENIPV